MPARPGVCCAPRLDAPRGSINAQRGVAFGTTVAYAGTAARIPAPRPVTGALFGLGVWVASYAGCAPAIGILPPPADEPRERNAMLVGAHVVWGSALGWAFSALEPARPAG